MPKNIAIVGSRSFTDYAVFKAKLSEVSISSDDTIVSGGAKGPDSMAEKYASERGMKTIIHKPDWDRYGKSAGFLRNQLIIDDADLVIAFHDGKSRGTASSISLAKKSNKPLIVFVIAATG